MTAKETLKLCRECAYQVYGVVAPNGVYGERVARLLAGTAAAESGLVHRRQMGFDLNSPRGAWGLWQTEKDALGENMARLARDPRLAANAARFLFGTSDHLAGLLLLDTLSLLRLVHDWDRFAVLMCRLHYLRFRDPVPHGLQAQAAYWKAHYNTVAGSGTVEHYIDSYHHLIEPAV